MRRSKSLDPLFLLFFLVVPVLFGAGLAAEGRSSRSPAEIYGSACASCHGYEGKGQPAATVGFDIPLPDFTECSFSTREPDADWLTVVRLGGPARAFDRMMPSFDEALTEEEILLALAHVRTFCPKPRSWPRGELNLPRPLVTAKAFPEDETVLSTAVNLVDRQAVMSKLIYEQRLGARGQAEVILPFGFLETEDRGWTGGVGDLGLATKWCLLHSLRTGSILSVALETFLPTGRKDRGLGQGVTRFEPFLAFGQMLPWEGFLQLQGGAEVSTEPDRVAHELFWRAVLGTQISLHGTGRTFSPMVEVLGARALEDGAKVEWDLAPQMQVTLSTRQHVRLGAGVRLPVTDTQERTMQFMMYLLWDWFDGSLFEGWVP